MNTTMRSYEAQVRRFWNIHCCLYKVSSHLSETDTYILYGWCVFRCGSKRAHQKDMCSKEIGQCAQNLWTIVGSVLSIEWGVYYHSVRKRIFTFIMNNIFTWTPKIMRMATGTYCICYSSLHYLCVSYATRCGRRAKSVHLRPIYLNTNQELHSHSFKAETPGCLRPFCQMWSLPLPT
jgi:hypothetical protein